MTPSLPKEVVRAGYDAISWSYRSDDFDATGTWYETLLDALESRVPDGSRVLDLGCGCGVPVAQRLAIRHRLVGVDISERQIERARLLVPGATFIRGDMTELAFDPDSFDAIVAFFAIIHVPLDQHEALLDSVASWLRPGGVATLTVGDAAWTGTEGDWYGAPMYWSHADRDTYRDWLVERGLRVEEEWFVPEDEGGHAAFLVRSLDA